MKTRHDDSEDQPFALESDARRVRGERVIAVVRVALSAFAVAGLVASNLGTSSRVETALEFVYLGVLAGAISYSLWLLAFLRTRGYRRFLPWASATIDVSFVSLTLIVSLTLPVSLDLARVLLTLYYSAYLATIALSLTRHLPQTSAYTGILAALQYVLIVTAYRYFQDVLPVDGSGTSLWHDGIVTSEYLKGLFLLLVGLAGYVIAGSLNRQSLSTASVDGAYLAQFFESTPEAIALSDNQTRVLRINRAFTEMFGYTEAEAVGRSIDDLVVPKAAKPSAHDLSQRVIDGSQFLVESVRRRKDRSLVDVSILGAPIFRQGKQVAIFAVYRDVTEQKRKERLFQALNEAASATQGALSHQQILDAVGSQLEKLGYGWNVLLLQDDQKVMRLEHLSVPSGLLKAAERLMGRSSYEITVPIDSDPDLAAAVTRGETRFVADSTVMVRSILPPALKGLAGRIVKILGVGRTIGAPLIQEGRIIGILGVHSPSLRESDLSAVTAFANQLSAAWQRVSLIDKLEKSISELQQTQAQLIQAQKMEAIGRLAGGVAHDFNNLLTVISGYGELLGADHNLDPAAQDSVDEIRKASEQAAQLTGHLLAFSRKQVFRPRIVEVNHTVQTMEKMLRRLIGEDIQLVTDLAPQLDPIQSDPHQIEQVIMNLAINARDAMPQGGTLRLRTANIYLDAEFVSRHPEVSEGRFVLLALSDTGSGIPEDILPKIFEPFFTTKERGRGTGLGLSTVYGIVRQSQGYVFAENVPGQGARISVYFPVSADDAPAGATPVEADGELHGTEQILLVEDEESVRRLTESILTGSGYRVVATANAQQALQLADSQLEQTSLLITDVVMPGMNGRGLARTLRRRFPELKVLYVTGYAPSPAGTQVVEDNDKELLLKPFSRLDLLRRVRQLTDG